MCGRDAIADCLLKMLHQRNRVAFPLLILLTVLLSPDPSLEQHDSPNSRSEKRTLLQLRSSLGIRSKEWPVKKDPCVGWVGVSCSNGSVTELNISGFKRTRRSSQDPKFAVEALTNLTKLTSFNASRFLLPGSIPAWFGQNLTSLEILDLRFCSISNGIPETMGNLVKLTSLYLSGNALTSMIPSSFGQLVNLSVLDLSGNRLTGSIPDSFDSLQSLQRLDMSSNALSGPIAPSIGKLSSLQYLNLSWNNLGSIVPEMNNLSNLVELDLSFNSLTGTITEVFSGMVNLKTLIIGNNLLTGSLVATMFPSPSRLEVLDLPRNKFTGAFPSALWYLPRLLVLDLSSNNFTGALPDEFRDNITLAKLNMSSNLFYGNLTSLLRRFNSIDLSGNYYEGEVPSFVNVNDILSQNCLQNVSMQRSLEECSSFYKERGLVFDNFGLANTPIQKRSRSGSSHLETILFASIFGGIGIVLIIVSIILLTLCCCKKDFTIIRGSNASADAGPGPTETIPPPPEVQKVSFSGLGDKFSIQSLLEATDNFSDLNLIKHGHSGSLFKGTLENGSKIVVKRVDSMTAKKDAYLVELDLFSKVSDSRLIPFLGHCLDNENEKFLIYKYMPNDDLASAFYRKRNAENDGLKSLDWITRLKIATGAAEGLCHLHDSNPSIVHRDIQASSILLDDKFEVRLGSLSEVCTQEPDPQQSRISKFLRFPQSSEQGASGSGTATCAYDVYCFGKVLLELVTGKLSISSSNDAQMHSLVEQFTPYISRYDKELVTTIVDQSLVIDEDLLEEVWAMAIVARSCLHPRPSRRPPMKYILKALENPSRVVREEHNGSGRLKPSSKGSWSSALSSSWRHSVTDVTVPPPHNGKGGSSTKRSTTSNSQGSGHNNGGENSSSRRYFSKEIYPEPDEDLDLERPTFE